MLRFATALSIVLLLALAVLWLARSPATEPRSGMPSSASVQQRAEEFRADPRAAPPRRPVETDRPAPESSVSKAPRQGRSAPDPFAGRPQVPFRSAFELGGDPLDAAATMPVHVTVFSPEGAPQSAAKVQWVWTPDAAELAPSASVVPFEHRMWRNNAAVPYAAAEGVTDAEGRVTLDVPRELEGAFWLRVGHADQVAYQQRLFGSRVEGERLRVVLRSGATLRGVVHGVLPSAEDFGPRTKVEGVSVMAWRVEGEQRVFGKRAALDLEGAAPRSWSISGLEPGVYEVKVMAWVSNPSATQWKGLHTVPHRVVLHRGSTGDLSIVMPTGGTVVRCAMR